MALNAPGSGSLVKYDTPVLVTGNKLKPVKTVAARIDKKGPLPSTEDILCTILPPRSWTQDGQLWTQHVSSTPATRIDVVNLQVCWRSSACSVGRAARGPLPSTLQEQLDLKLQQRQARETGICPIREELYAQTFGASLKWGGRMGRQSVAGSLSCA